MSETNLTPVDFLSKLKLKMAAPSSVGGQPSPAFLKIHSKELKEADLLGFNPEKWLDSYFVELFAKIAAIQVSAIRSRLLASVAVGCIDNSRVNACIVRSRHSSVFAILLNRALITMVNHYVKLCNAANYPESVLLFNGLSPTSLSSKTYIKASSAMIDHYRETGEPVGPELKLAGGFEASTYVEATLRMIHTFVLAHEIGHFVNGDLDSPKNFSKDNTFAAHGMVFGGPASHSKEYAADIFAFEALLRVLDRDSIQLPAYRVLDLSATLLFNILRDISNRGSETHPKPNDRLLSVTREFFGDTAAKLMEASFENLSAIETFRDHVSNVSITELLANRHGG